VIFAVVGVITIAVRLRVKLHFETVLTTFLVIPSNAEGTYTYRPEGHFAQHNGMTKFLRQAQDDRLFFLSLTDMALSPTPFPFKILLLVKSSAKPIS
jgi:hypothetical protein